LKICESEKLAQPWPADSTLVLVYFELESHGQEPGDTLPYPFGGFHASAIDHKIVGIADISVPSLLQHLVQFIKDNIGKQRRIDSLNAKGNFEFVRIVKLRRNKKDVVKRR
jgi:hypothetical protein